MTREQQVIDDIINDILNDNQISDSSLIQYCLDAIELVSPNKYSNSEKHSIIWTIFQDRNQTDEL